MNKAGLVELVVRYLGTGTSKAQAERAVNAVLQGMSAGLRKERNLSLSGFGTFEVRARKGYYATATRAAENLRACYAAAK